MTKSFKKDLTSGSADWRKLPQMKLVGYFLFFLRKLLEKYALWMVLWLTFWRGSHCMCVSFSLACLWRRPVYKMSSIPSIVEQWRVPFPLAKRVAGYSFPPCCSYAEVVRILLTLISPICVWKVKTHRHSWKQFNYGSVWSYTHKKSQTHVFCIWMLLILLKLN